MTLEVSQEAVVRKDNLGERLTSFIPAVSDVYPQQHQPVKRNPTTPLRDAFPQTFNFFCSKIIYKQLYVGLNHTYN